jgi:magnesium-transporting ATPase (P-type)
VKEAIAKLHRGGVNVVMITGDGEGTACAIAKEVGILDETVGPGMGRKVWLTGKEIDGESFTLPSYWDAPMIRP